MFRVVPVGTRTRTPRTHRGVSPAWEIGGRSARERSKPLRNTLRIKMRVQGFPDASEKVTSLGLAGRTIGFVGR